MKNLIQKCVFILFLFLITTISTAINSSNGIVNEKEYIAQIQKTINLRYKIDFSKSTHKKMRKEEVIEWVNGNSENRNAAIQEADWKIIEALLGQEKCDIYLLQNLESEGAELTEILVAHVSEKNIRLFHFSDYIITNEDKSDEPEPPAVCHDLYGYELDLTGAANPELVMKACQCAAESCPCPPKGSCAMSCQTTN